MHVSDKLGPMSTQEHEAGRHAGTWAALFTCTHLFRGGKAWCRTGADKLHAVVSTSDQEGRLA